MTDLTKTKPGDVLSERMRDHFRTKFAELITDDEIDALLQDMWKDFAVRPTRIRVPSRFGQDTYKDGPSQLRGIADKEFERAVVYGFKRAWNSKRGVTDEAPGGDPDLTQMLHEDIEKQVMEYVLGNWEAMMQYAIGKVLSDFTSKILARVQVEHQNWTPHND
jgi:hypothetical protein